MLQAPRPQSAERALGRPPRLKAPSPLPSAPLHRNRRTATPPLHPLDPIQNVPSTGQRRPALPRTSSAVLSALGGLASGFGTGPGVPPLPWPLTGGRRPRPGSRTPACPQGRTARGGFTETLSRSAAPALRALGPGRVERRVRARAISAARLRRSPALHLRPIDQVVYLGPYRKGELISGTASRLDAFSGYPRRTRLPGDAVGRQPVHRRSVHPGPLVLGAASSIPLRPRRIGTELSHDVLNPARVPL